MMETDQKGLLITRHLAVKLDEFRKQALHNIAHAEFVEEERLAIHLKNVTESLKGMIKVSHQKQIEANHVLHAGFEMKEVACRQVIDFEKNVITIYREDTGDKVEERALEPKERELLKKKAPGTPTPSSKPSTKEASHGV